MAGGACRCTFEDLRRAVGGRCESLQARRSVPRSLRSLAFPAGVKLGGLSLIPSEFDLATHARPRCHRQGACFKVPDQSPGLHELHLRGRVDVPMYLPARADRVGPQLSGDVSAGFDVQITLHLRVSLEAAGKA